jgi:signal peptidase I
MYIVIAYAGLLVSFRLLEVGDTVASIIVWCYLFLALTLSLLILGWARKAFKKTVSIVLGCLLLSFLYFRFTPLSGYSSDIAASASNTPTILEGDLIISKSFNLRLDRGVMVGVSYQNRRYRKRIHGIPGDTVAVCGLRAFVNGSTYSVASNWKGISIDGTDCASSPNVKYELSENEYFVIGDNLRESFDSRSYGPVEEEAIFAMSKFKVDGKTDQVSALSVEFL